MLIVKEKKGLNAVTATEAIANVTHVTDLAKKDTLDNNSLLTGGIFDDFLNEP